MCEINQSINRQSCTKSSRRLVHPDLRESNRHFLSVSFCLFLSRDLISFNKILLDALCLSVYLSFFVGRREKNRLTVSGTCSETCFSCAFGLPQPGIQEALKRRRPFANKAGRDRALDTGPHQRSHVPSSCCEIWPWRRARER